MDSVSQFVLGSTVAAVLLGPKLGLRAVALGGVVATLPDLDSFLPFDNALDSVTYHRGFSHSLFVQTAVSPFIAAFANFIFKNERISYSFMLLTVWLCLITHSLLDSLTTYGTQIFWPLDVGSPIAFPSVFIIDPIYTLTLLIGVIGFLFLIRKKQASAQKLVQVCLALSSFYLFLGMSAHLYVKSKASEHPQLVGKRIHVQPTPFNILYWQVLAVDDRKFYTAATSVLSGCSDLDLKSYPRLTQLPDHFAKQELPQSVKRFEWFTNGFYTYQNSDQGLKISDLRIGFAPFYPFSYVFGKATNSGFIPHPPKRFTGPKRDLSSLTNLYKLASLTPKGCW
ncbi:MAG: metal-dependent hydrolase [Rhodomicrobiaceae bacterium]